MAQDPYQCLGVSKGASDADIKKAYRKLAKTYHPDQNKDNPKAEERFRAVSNAYSLLSNAERRAKYDRGEIDADGNPRAPFGFSGGAAGGGGGRRTQSGAARGMGSDPFDLFADLFGGRSQAGGPGGPTGGFDFGQSARTAQSAPKAKGRTVDYALTIPFEDAVKLTPQRITLRNGKTLELKLPQGFTDDQQLRLPGQGEPGAGGSGDALVTLRVARHPFFERDGHHVRVEVPITLAEAVLGSSVKVPTVEGAVMLKVPPGTTSGKTLRIKGRGFYGKNGARGDQLVRLLIDVPAGDKELEDFVRKWRNAKAGKPRSHFGLGDG